MGKQGRCCKSMGFAKAFYHVLMQLTASAWHGARECVDVVCVVSFGPYTKRLRARKIKARTKMGKQILPGQFMNSQCNAKPVHELLVIQQLVKELVNGITHITAARAAFNAAPCCLLAGAHPLEHALHPLSQLAEQKAAAAS